MTRVPSRFLAPRQLDLQRGLVEGEVCVFDSAELEPADAPNVLIGADGAAEFRMLLATRDSLLQRVPIAAIWSYIPHFSLLVSQGSGAVLTAGADHRRPLAANAANALVRAW